MKKLNRILIGTVITIVVIVVTLLGIGATYWWNTWQSPDFHQTTGVSWSAVQKESQKQREVLVFYKEGCPWCQAAKPEVEKASQVINTANPVKYVYINIESAEGIDVRKNLGAEIKSVPSIVPIEKGGRVVTNISFDGQTYSFPNTDQLVSAKPGVIKVKIKDQVQVNTKIFTALKDGVWLND